MSRSKLQTSLPDGFRPEAFQHGIVRDLSWLISSPSLMSLPDSLKSDWLFRQQNIKELLREFDLNPQPLLNCLRHQAQFRLGYYFEDLVRIYLKYFTQPVDLKNNIQVFRDKTTVGEYDFLLQLESGRKIHLETAVKFYICTEEQSDHCSAECFVGPNLSDRLDRKWHRLMHHQINLSRTEAGIDQAESINLLPDQRSILLRGYLFYNYTQWQSVEPVAPINPEHCRGWWLRAKQLEKLKHEGRFTVLMKPCWLSKARPHFQNTLSFDELIELSNSISTPLLIARLEQYDDRFWTETDRGFLVPDNWNL